MPLFIETTEEVDIMNLRTTCVSWLVKPTLMLLMSLFASTFVSIGISEAASAMLVDGRVSLALERARNEMKGRVEYLDVKAYLVLPRVIKAGLIVGGEYGEGALLIGGKAVDYYSYSAGSVGLQIGVQEKNIILVFTEDEALKKFRGGSGWKAGVDGSVVVVNTGVGGFNDTTTGVPSIIAFVFGQRGLMFNVTFEGAKFTKLKK